MTPSEKDRLNQEELEAIRSEFEGWARRGVLPLVKELGIKAGRVFQYVDALTEQLKTEQEISDGHFASYEVVRDQRDALEAENAALKQQLALHGVKTE